MYFRIRSLTKAPEQWQQAIYDNLLREDLLVCVGVCMQALALSDMSEEVHLCPCCLQSPALLKPPLPGSEFRFARCSMPATGARTPKPRPHTFTASQQLDPATTTGPTWQPTAGHMGPETHGSLLHGRASAGSERRHRVHSAAGRKRTKLRDSSSLEARVA